MSYPDEKCKVLHPNGYFVLSQMIILPTYLTEMIGNKSAIRCRFTWIWCAERSSTQELWNKPY